MGVYRPALFDHPVFKFELLTDNLEGLVQDLARVLIGARPDGQVDHALVFRFQVDRHEALPWFSDTRFSPAALP